jgi:hypothetical protein
LSTYLGSAAPTKITAPSSALTSWLVPVPGGTS